MANIYFRHILAGDITLEDVPRRWRQKVQEMLDKHEDGTPAEESGSGREEDT